MHDVDCENARKRIKTKKNARGDSGAAWRFKASEGEKSKRVWVPGEKRALRQIVEADEARVPYSSKGYSMGRENAPRRERRREVLEKK